MPHHQIRQSMIFLNEDELIELTKRVRYSAQIRALRFMGIDYKVRPDGSVAVLRSHVDGIFGGIANENKPVQAHEPNWSAI